MGSSRFRLQKLQRRRTGWPVATVAVYGPDDERATKLVVGIIASETSDADPLRKWYCDEGDVRSDEVLEEVLAMLESHGVRRLAMPDRVIGCPHEEGTDYEGETCPDPACAFWVGVDRWTGEQER